MHAKTKEQPHNLIPELNANQLKQVQKIHLKQKSIKPSM